MSDAKIPCRMCGAAILIATAERTGGVCMPCKRNIPPDPFHTPSMRLMVSDLLTKQPSLAPVLDRILEEAAVGMQLIKDPSDASSLGASRIGGLPDVGAGFEWPRFAGQPLGFLAQINCAEANRFDPDQTLPSSGLLQFFYAIREQPWGFDPKDRGGAAVVFTRSGSLTPGKAPDDLDPTAILPAHGMAFRPFASLPVPGSFTLESLNLTDDQTTAYESVLRSLPGDWIPGQPAHFLLGQPCQVQGDMQLDCQLVTNGLYCGNASGYDDPRAKGLEAGAADWRLLFQFDSDEDLNVMWGDAGMVYFWIRRTDLKQHKFNDTWTILQCT